MPDPSLNNAERRSFFKWCLLGTASALAAAGGYGTALLGKEKESMVVALKDSLSRGHYRRIPRSSLSFKDHPAFSSG